MTKHVTGQEFRFHNEPVPKVGLEFTFTDNPNDNLGVEFRYMEQAFSPETEAPSPPTQFFAPNAITWSPEGPPGRFDPDGFLEGYIEGNRMGADTHWFPTFNYTFNPVNSYRLTVMFTTEAEVLGDGDFDVYSAPANLNTTAGRRHKLNNPFAFAPNINEEVAELSMTLGPGGFSGGWDANVADPAGFEPKFFFELPGGVRLYGVLVEQIPQA